MVKNFQIAAFYWVALTGCGAGLVLTMPKPARMLLLPGPPKRVPKRPEVEAGDQAKATRGPKL